MSYSQLLIEAGQDLDLSIDDVVEKKQKKGGGKQRTDAMSVLMQTIDDILEGIKGNP